MVRYAKCVTVFYLFFRSLWGDDYDQNHSKYNFITKRFAMAGKVREFCLITSVKGIPRLLRTKSVVMRFVWTISVIGFLCMASFQAMLLTMEYFQYKTYTSTGEVIIDYFGQAGGFTGMPDITLCNANPYASNKNLSNDLLTLEGYYKLAEEATTCDNNCRDAEREPLQHIRHEIMSTRGYFNYIGRLNAKQLGHTFESFVVNCELDMEGGGVLLHSIPCLPTVQIIEIQHSMLYNCYTIRLPRNKFPDTVFRGFRAVLHLDDYEALHKEQTLLNPHGEPGQMSGVWMFAHERNKPLYTYYNRMMLQPGHYHDIPVKMELRTYLPPPHGLCEDMEGLDYSLLQCYFDCIQERIYEQCGCLDLQNYTSQWNPTVTKGPFCLSLSLNKSAMIKNWKCISRERPKAIAGCVASCPVPCKETRHNLRVCK